MDTINLTKNFWKPMRPSNIMELQELKDEAYTEAVSFLKKNPTIKAKTALKQLIASMDIRKILCDMYVWQRVDAVKEGINEALENPKLKL